jgi:hypothetical protein
VFASSIQELDETIVDLEVQKGKHVCPKYPEVVDGFASEIESKKSKLQDLPPSFRKLVDNNRDVFKDTLSKDDFIKVELLPGYAGHEHGVKIDIDSSVKPIANRSTRAVPLLYQVPV